MIMSSTPPSNCFEASVRIAARIVEEAIWHGQLCNWVGAQPLERMRPGHNGELTYRALGPELYSGTSGVALFLAELFAITGDPALRKTALGAIRHSRERLESIAQPSRLGLFTGWIGIALVTARIAIILGDASLLRHARELARQVISGEYERRDFDMISGRSGAIAALVVLHAIFNDPMFLEAAVRFGTELIEAAAQGDDDCSWELPGIRSYHNLMGFSHGTAGAAVALLELHSETGAGAFKDAALRAFQYERRHFNAERGNWPDFRRDIDPGMRRPREFPCISYWCHGAPGIALSRLRAYELLSDQTFKAEAIIALNTTRASITSAIETSTGNYSLCHGLAGNGEAMLYGNQILDGPSSVDLRLVLDAADSATERYSMPGIGWPCGTHTGETPGMMLGLSGIGHHFLRLSGRRVPSIAILRKQEWNSA
jgi:lantibiotic modifying enzyme